MSLTFINSKNDSEAKNEFVILRATNDLELSDYAIVDRTFAESGEESNKFRHIYRFPKWEIKEGELVVLCNGEDKVGNRKYRDNDGEMVNVFFWQSKECIWNNLGDTAILIKYKIVDRYPLKSIEK